MVNMVEEIGGASFLKENAELCSKLMFSFTLLLALLEKISPVLKLLYSVSWTF
jgi:hypothetical protein